MVRPLVRRPDFDILTLWNQSTKKFSQPYQKHEIEMLLLWFSLDLVQLRCAGRRGLLQFRHWLNQ